MIAVLRHSPFAAAILLYIALEVITDIYVIPRTDLAIRTNVGISFLIGLAILIWLVTNDRRTEPAGEHED